MHVTQLEHCHSKLFIDTCQLHYKQNGPLKLQKYNTLEVVFAVQAKRMRMLICDIPKIVLFIFTLKHEVRKLRKHLYMYERRQSSFRGLI